MNVTIQHSHALSNLLSLVISVEVREELGFELFSPGLVFICYTTISVPFHVNNWECVPGNELKMCTIIPEFNLHPVSPSPYDVSFWLIATNPVSEQQQQLSHAAVMHYTGSRCGQNVRPSHNTLWKQKPVCGTQPQAHWFLLEINI